MKTLLYIGNKLSGKGKTSSTVETLGSYLENEDFVIRTYSSQSNKILRLFDMLFSIVKHSKYSDYVLIDTYSTQNFFYAFFCSQLCRILKLKYLPILHGGNLPNRLKHSPRLSKALFKNAYVNIAPSLYTQSAFETLGYYNVKCIPNAIQIENYVFKERKLDSLKLLWVRSFSELYNSSLAIDILHQLKLKGFEASLCMVGPDNDGSLVSAKKYAESHGVAVTFTGKLSKKEWTTLAANYNVFINTTNFDNMPVSVIEAMALGLPVVSTNVGGMPYLIEDGKDGVLVNPNNADEFVNSIMHLQNNPETVVALTRNARNKVKNFGWNVVKNQWVETLK